ncbi:MULTISPECIES: cytochrome c1 [Rhodomicrobium]|uniref:cytochrome c1 n=1 Tax=Rhodomicrobium TaxID=1068 RepID=UPI000B4BD92D|nr:MULTISPECIES: cytochrome c1 [Rhodomicrobium]
MTLFSQRGWRKSLTLLVAASAIAYAGPSRAAEGEGSHGAEASRQDWTFGGLTGHFDRAQLRRGYTVYKNVCAACHGMRLMYFRNLSQPGGPEFATGNVEQFASEAQVQDGPDDNGDMFTRPGKPSDRFPSPYANAKAAAAAQNGAVPPDLSVMAKARAVESSGAWYMSPFHWIRDIVTNYQEGGPDYIYALLTGYAEPPAGFNLTAGMNYNKAFPGHQIAMPQPLTDGSVEYTDGTPGTVDNYARDVTAFLMWSAEPKLEERKRMGLKVLIYLVILAGLLYLSKRALWRNVKH